MSDSSASLARLKRRLERLGHQRRTAPAGLFALGCPALDARLGGGLARGALHEVCAAPADQASAAGFALMLAIRAGGGRPLLWIREDRGERREGELYGPGLAELGASPESLVLVRAPDTVSALRAGADGLGCGALGAVIVEPGARATALDLTASRKLVLAAEATGVPAFVLRDGETRLASAAASRWLAGAARSQPLPGQAPGQTALCIELVRHRGGVAPFSTFVEWDRDTRSFAEPALSRPLLSAVQRGQMAA